MIIFDYCLSDRNKTNLTYNGFGIQKISHTQEHLRGFADTSNSSVVKQLSPAKIPLLKLPKSTVLSKCSRRGRRGENCCRYTRNFLI